MIEFFYLPKHRVRLPSKKTLEISSYDYHVDWKWWFWYICYEAVKRDGTVNQRMAYMYIVLFN